MEAPNTRSYLIFVSQYHYGPKYHADKPDAARNGSLIGCPRPARWVVEVPFGCISSYSVKEIPVLRFTPLSEVSKISVKNFIALLCSQYSKIRIR